MQKYDPVLNLVTVAEETPDPSFLVSDLKQGQFAELGNNTIVMRLYQSTSYSPVAVSLHNGDTWTNGVRAIRVVTGNITIVAGRP